MMSRQVNMPHLSHGESVFHSAKKNIINRYQSPCGLGRNNRKFGFENIIDASEGIILRIEDQHKITMFFFLYTFKK